jgi:hypothetical protein
MTNGDAIEAWLSREQATILDSNTIRAAMRESFQGFRRR